MVIINSEDWFEVPEVLIFKWMRVLGSFDMGFVFFGIDIVVEDIYVYNFEMHGIIVDYGNVMLINFISCDNG